MKIRLLFLAVTIVFAAHGSSFAAATMHDWNLGATGLRGWIHCDKLVTSDARQITVTRVEKGSPADGVLAVGDGILGFGGKPFSYDPRTEMGKALTLAESEAGQGKLSLTRSRAGSEAGVKDPALDLAIERSTRLLRFYIGKGAIPYGDHHPWIENHEDNGKCGMAAVLFNQLGESKGAEFLSRMSVASHGPERDTGHTGNFFNMLWAMPGVAQSGPQATGAWMNEFGSWYFDLARGVDGNFLHQGPPEFAEDSYAGWDSTGGYLLAYAMPLKKLYLTGKKSGVLQLDAAAAQSLIVDGRGWNNKDRTSFYDALSDDQLLERLHSWSPVVRERAAMAVGRRKNALVARLIQMLASPSLDARYGACQSLILLRGRGAPAVDALQRTLAQAAREAT